jgi:predicted transcriptional regulator
MNNTVTLPESLVKRLEKISSSSRLTPQALIEQAVSDRLNYEEWALEQIDAGLADIEAGRVLSDDEFWTKIASSRYERKEAA